MRVSVGFYAETGIPGGSALHGGISGVAGCRSMDGSGGKGRFLLRE